MLNINTVAIIALAVAPTLWRLEVKTQPTERLLAGRLNFGNCAAILAVWFGVLDLVHISTAASFLHIAGAALLFFAAGLVYNFKVPPRLPAVQPPARYGIAFALVCGLIGISLLQGVPAFS